MSLIGALNAGKTALAVHQAALQVTSNNIANAGNADYTRQTAGVSPVRDRMLAPGMFIGQGIQLDSIRRSIDESLESRLRAGISDQASAGVQQQWLSRMESVFNELGDDDLSTRMSAFFQSWSNLANQPQDLSRRQVVIQSGQSLVEGIRQMRSQFGGLLSDVDTKSTALVRDANGILDQIAGLNRQIGLTETGTGGQANGLRDQRDALLKRLSGILDVRSVPQANGLVNLYIGSEPILVGGDSRGLDVRLETVDGDLVATPIIQSTGQAIEPTGGELAGLLRFRGVARQGVTDLDDLAGGLIFELNKIHSSGQGLFGLTDVAGSVQTDDPAAALNSAASGLAHLPGHGSFVVHVRNAATGQVTSTLVSVDLDGVGGDDMTLNDLAAVLDGIAGVSAAVEGGRLRVRADSGQTFGFSQDSSGVLAATGVNGFFSGSDAGDIAVSAAIVAAPSLLAASGNGEVGDNQAALAIAGLETRAIAGLRGATLKQAYESMVNGIAVTSAAAGTTAEASTAIVETLSAQREALSGVSLDEEALNLMRQQRAFQGAARVIATINELMAQVLALV